MGLFDFKGLAALLLSDAPKWLVNWCPGGRIVGAEYTASSIRGGVGDSFKCNVETGAWADFATDQKGLDLISLFANVEGIKQGEAAKHLAKLVNYPLDSDRPSKGIIKREPPIIGTPPDNTPPPPMIHPKWGLPVASWCYRHPSQLPIYWEARYDAPEGKQYIPWSWDKTTQRWIAKAYPPPRPLWGLDRIYRQPNVPILIVEGAKCAEAARNLVNSVYEVVTWSGGAQSYSKADWTPLKSRDILIWPDSDAPGVAAGAGIAEILLSTGAKSVKILNVDGMPDKWDVADAAEEGWDWNKFKEWATPRATVIAIPTTPHRNGTAPKDDEDVPSLSSTALYEQYGIAVNGQGRPYFNLDNALRVMERVPTLQDFAWFDEFYQRYFTKWNGNQREWADVDTINLTRLIQSEFGLPNITDKMVLQAMTTYAHKRESNAPKDWMESLTWDGTARINTFFWDCFGAAESEYSHAIGANFWIGMVARIYRPGCQLDNMVILEGMQGTGKTSAIRIIGGDWYANAHDSIQNKDFFLALQGKIIIEISELESFSKAEITRIKQVVTCTADRFRAPYGRTSEDHPRRSIFIASTNEKTYLKDHTGARRFWPLRCHKIDLDKIAAQRDQLFAEAVARFKNRERWYEMPAELTGAEQEKRRQSDAWEQEIAAWLPTLMIKETTIRNVAVELLKIDIGNLDPQIQIRISKALTNCGWELCFPANVWQPKAT